MNWVGVGLLLLMSQVQVQAQLAVPVLSGHVVDTTATMTQQQVHQLDGKLTTFEQTAGSQVVVLLVPTTQPEDIASYANRVANTWKIGRKGVGDGLLVIVAKNDLQIRIEVSKTLEGAIPDLAAKRIIDQAISPCFRQGDFFGGLDAGADQIMARIQGEALPAPAAGSSSKHSGFDWNDLAVLMFIVVPVVGGLTRRILGSKLGSVATGGIAGLIAMLVTSSLLIAGFTTVGALLFTLFSDAAQRNGRSGGGYGFGGGFGGGGSGSGGGFSVSAPPTPDLSPESESDILSPSKFRWRIKHEDGKAILVKPHRGGQVRGNRHQGLRHTARSGAVKLVLLAT